jgi:hypothetical protein
MREMMRYGALVAVLFVFHATAGQAPAARAAPQTLALPAKPAHAHARLSAADEARLEAMIAQHQRVRSRLPAKHQIELDQLTAQVKVRLFSAPIRSDLLPSAAQIVSTTIPGLTAPEATSLAEYVLGGIAAGGSSQAGLMNATSSMQETQMSFNLQYLQLQSQMQDENRSYTAVSNIMKTKHDTVKNSIGNIR